MLSVSSLSDGTLNGARFAEGCPVCCGAGHAEARPAVARNRAAVRPMAIMGIRVGSAASAQKEMEPLYSSISANLGFMTCGRSAQDRALFRTSGLRAQSARSGISLVGGEALKELELPRIDFTTSCTAPSMRV